MFKQSATTITRKTNISKTENNLTTGLKSYHPSSKQHESLKKNKESAIEPQSGDTVPRKDDHQSHRLKSTSTPNPVSPKPHSVHLTSRRVHSQSQGLQQPSLHTSDQEDTCTHTHHDPKSRLHPLLQIFVHRRANGMSW